MFRFLLHPTSRASPRDTTPLNPPYILESFFPTHPVSYYSRRIPFSHSPSPVFVAPPHHSRFLLSSSPLPYYARIIADLWTSMRMKHWNFAARALFHFPSLSTTRRVEWQPGINDVSLREFLAWEFMASVFQGENWNHGFQCHLCPMTSFMSRNVRIRWFFSFRFVILCEKRNLERGRGNEVNFRNEGLYFFCYCFYVIFNQQ